MNLSMTVAELRDRMGAGEFAEWCEFYELYPFDDLHRLYRPAAMVSVSFGGGELNPRLEWLQPNPALAGWSQGELNSFAAHGIKPPPRYA